MRIREWWWQFRNPPYVEISHYAQATPRPRVSVSVVGPNGLQGVYDFSADEQGEASATMYGNSLARIVRRRLVDRRAVNGDDSHG